MKFREFKKVNRLIDFDGEFRTRLNNVIRNSKSLSTEEEYEIACKWVETHDVKYRDQLVNANLKFVFSVSKKFEGIGIPIEDLFQTGCIGLVEAVNKYNPNLGFKLISFAVNYIQMEILKVIQTESRFISVPTNIGVILHQIKIFRSKFYLLNERYPTDEEVLKEFHKKEHNVKNALQYKSVEHLSDTINDDSDYTYEQILGTSFMHEMLESDYDSKLIAYILKDLPERTQDILLSAYGVGKEAESFEVIGKRLGVSRERIRQIVVKTQRELAKKHKLLGLHIKTL